MEGVVVVVLVTVRVSVDWLLAASLAVMIIVLVPMTRGMLLIDQLVVPDTVPQEVPLLVQVTELTPMLSLAEPETVRVDAVVEWVLAEVGEAMEMEGGAVSVTDAVVKVICEPLGAPDEFIATAR